MTFSNTSIDGLTVKKAHGKPISRKTGKVLQIKTGPLNEAGNQYTETFVTRSRPDDSGMAGSTPDGDMDRRLWPKVLRSPELGGSIGGTKVKAPSQFDAPPGGSPCQRRSRSCSPYRHSRRRPKPALRPAVAFRGPEPLQHPFEPIGDRDHRSTVGVARREVDVHHRRGRVGHPAVVGKSPTSPTAAANSNAVNMQTGPLYGGELSRPTTASPASVLPHQSRRIKGRHLHRRLKRCPPDGH